MVHHSNSVLLRRNNAHNKGIRPKLFCEKKITPTINTRLTVVRIDDVQQRSMQG